MRKKWKIILIALIMLPMVVFFPACSCNNNEDNSNREPTQYTVRFYTDSSDTFNIPSQIVEEGNLVRRPENPTKTGFVFIGWYKDPTLTRLWSFEIDTVVSNITLYARWEAR